MWADCPLISVCSLPQCPPLCLWEFREKLRWKILPLSGPFLFCTEDVDDLFSAKLLGSYPGHKERTTFKSSLINVCVPLSLLLIAFFVYSLKNCNQRQLKRPPSFSCQIQLRFRSCFLGKAIHRKSRTLYIFICFDRCAFVSYFHPIRSRVLQGKGTSLSTLVFRNNENVDDFLWASLAKGTFRPAVDALKDLGNVLIVLGRSTLSYSFWAVLGNPLHDLCHVLASQRITSTVCFFFGVCWISRGGEKSHLFVTKSLRKRARRRRD
jgi:hypothetical protein